MKATLDHLKGPQVEPGTVEVDGLEFDIRPISRKEHMRVQETQTTAGLAAAEALLLHLGMVDPAISIEQADEWMSDPSQSARIEAVSRGIGVISGMLPESGKQAYKSAGGEPGA